MPIVATEAVCCSPGDVVIADRCGVDRVELCIGIEHGGLTPSPGLVRFARANTSAFCLAMVRLRNGDFCYSKSEVDVMRHDIEGLVEAGAQGLVIGALTTDGEVDFDVCEILIKDLPPVELTFHRAIDSVSDPLHSIQQLIDLGFGRILASGKANTAMDGAATLREWIQATDGRCTICPAGGTRSSNVVEILRATGARQTHQGPFTTLPHNQTDPKLFGDTRLLNEDEVRATVLAVREYERTL